MDRGSIMDEVKDLAGNAADKAKGLVGGISDKIEAIAEHAKKLND